MAFDLNQESPMSATIQHAAPKPKNSAVTPNRHRPNIQPDAPKNADTLADRIRARAFQSYEARTANGGAVDPVSDWLQAERELSPTSLEPKSLEDAAKARARCELLLAGRD